MKNKKYFNVTVNFTVAGKDHADAVNKIFKLLDEPTKNSDITAFFNRVNEWWDINLPMDDVEAIEKVEKPLNISLNLESNDRDRERFDDHDRLSSVRKLREHLKKENE